MNLIIDVGNTFVKFAVFQNDALIYKTHFKLEAFTNKFLEINSLFSELENCIVSSVGKLDKDHVDLVVTHLKVLILDSSTKLPFDNLYKTPKTLGVDRLALVSASVKDFTKKNVLIIDAGTCITYDFINSNNEFLGGSISPGIRLRYVGLNNFTAKLPLLETKKPKNIIGNTTKKAIHSGVVFGVINEIDGVIGTYKEEFTDLTVILTGGDAKFLSKQLKSSIFANSNFLLEGLNYILQFNSKK